MEPIFEKILFKLSERGILNLGTLMQLYGVDQEEIAHRVIGVFLETETSINKSPVRLYFYREDKDTLVCAHYTYVDYLLSLDKNRRFRIFIQVILTREQMTLFKEAYRRSMFLSPSDAFGAALDLYLRLTKTKIDTPRNELVVMEHNNKPLRKSTIKLEVLEALSRQNLHAILGVDGSCKLISK